jgi:outer membrane protein assembly factor BamB
VNRKYKWAMSIALGLMIAAALAAAASPPFFSEEVTDYGRSRYRTHYTPKEPEYPLAKESKAAWEVPLGLSRSQPLVIQRDFNGDGRPETRIYHIAGDRLWALDGAMTPPARRTGQSVQNYQQQLAGQGFILWSTPAEALCNSQELLGKDDLLAIKCSKVGPRNEARPFASSQAAYQKGKTPADDVIYVGFGHPAALVAIRATDGQVLGGFIIDAKGDRGIVGAPLIFGGDTVVVGTTSGETHIIRGLATGVASDRRYDIGGRISYSPMPMGDSGFIMATDARQTPQLGTHGYMMAFSLGEPGVTEFTPKWPAAVITPAGVPGEAAIDAQSIYFADKFGRLYALRVDTGEMLWCRQYPGLGACGEGGNPPSGFINNGPGVDEDRVYFVFRNNQGPNKGGGYVVALNKATGAVVWQRAMEFKGNTAPVPMGCHKTT